MARTFEKLTQARLGGNTTLGLYKRLQHFPKGNSVRRNKVGSSLRGKPVRPHWFHLLPLVSGCPLLGLLAKSYGKR